MINEPLTVPPTAPAFSVTRWKNSARYFSTSRRFLSLVDQAIVSLTGMATTITLGRLCGKQQLGLYVSGLSLILLVTAVQNALLAVPYTICSAGMAMPQKRSYKGTTLLQQAGLSGIAAVMFVGSGTWQYSHRDGRDLYRVLFALAIVSTAVCFRDFARRLSYAELDFGFALTIDAVLAGIQVVGIALLAYLHRLSALHVLFVVAIASACAGGMWLSGNWRSFDISVHDALASLRINWRLGRWLLGSSLLWSVCIDQYPWLLTLSHSAAAAGVWASCYGVMAFLNPVVLALNNDAAPRVANDYEAHGVAGLRRSVHRSALIAGWVTLPILVVLVTYGGRLVVLMYGKQYAGNGLIVTVLAIGLWCYAVSLAFPYGLLGLKRPGVDFSLNVLCIVAYLLIGLPLLLRFGVLGAAGSFLLVQVVALVGRVVSFQAVSQRAAALHEVAA